MAPLRKFELLRAEVRQVRKIDLINQTFAAQVFLQFRIENGALDEDLVKDIDSGNKPTFPADSKRPGARWYLAQFAWRNAEGAPNLLDERVVRMGSDLHMLLEADGIFYQRMPLSQFPVDIQSLTIGLSVACAEEGIVPAEFTGTTSNVRFVDVDNFVLSSEWIVNPNLSLEARRFTPMQGRTYPCLALSVHVYRRPFFYLMNIAVPTSLFCVLAVMQFYIPLTKIDARLTVSVLTFVAATVYMNTTKSLTPAVSYMTEIDMFNFVCLIIRVIIILEAGVVYLLVDDVDLTSLEDDPNYPGEALAWEHWHHDTATLVDRICLGTTALMWLLANCCFGYRWYSLSKTHSHFDTNELEQNSQASSNYLQAVSPMNELRTGSRRVRGLGRSKRTQPSSPTGQQGLGSTRDLNRSRPVAPE